MVSPATRGSTIAAFGGIPGIGLVLANFHRANFAELLALLIENQVPLDEAVTLAAESTGNRRIISGAQKIARDVRAGHKLADSFHSGSPFSPFMQWMMSIFCCLTKENLAS